MKEGSELLPIGRRAWCSSHTGILVAYFVAERNSEFLGEHNQSTELYGVLSLDEPYWSTGVNGHGVYIAFLVVHADNLTDHKPVGTWD